MGHFPLWAQGAASKVPASVNEGRGLWFGRPGGGRGEFLSPIKEGGCEPPLRPSVDILGPHGSPEVLCTRGPVALQDRREGGWKESQGHASLGPHWPEKGLAPPHSPCAGLRSPGKASQLTPWLPSAGSDARCLPAPPASRFPGQPGHQAPPAHALRLPSRGGAPPSTCPPPYPIPTRLSTLPLTQQNVWACYALALGP